MRCSVLDSATNVQLPSDKSAHPTPQAQQAQFTHNIKCSLLLNTAVKLSPFTTIRQMICHGASLASRSASRNCSALTLAREAIMSLCRAVHIPLLQPPGCFSSCAAHAKHHAAAASHSRQRVLACQASGRSTPSEHHERSDNRTTSSVSGRGGPSKGGASSSRSISTSSSEPSSRRSSAKGSGSNSRFKDRSVSSNRGNSSNVNSSRNSNSTTSPHNTSNGSISSSKSGGNGGSSSSSNKCSKRAPAEDQPPGPLTDEQRCWQAVLWARHQLQQLGAAYIFEGEASAFIQVIIASLLLWYACAGFHCFCPRTCFACASAVAASATRGRW